MRVLVNISTRTMPKIGPPDVHFLNAAVGWLGLGLRSEARAELDSISPENQRHPDVLETRWVICAEEKQWDAALDVARKLLLSAPDRPSGWLHHAFALRRADASGLEKARESLKLAAEKFPAEPIIPYNLSCYACQLRHLDEAKLWLRRAFIVGGKDRIKRMALEDPDLKPLWQEIKKL